MTITVKHKFVSAIPDEADATVVRPSNWNDTHDIVGLGTSASLDAGVANGVATLDSSGTVPLSQIPALGDLNYQGTWNATTNSPTLTSSVGTKGFYYVVSVAGTTSLNGITDWQIGDWAVFNGSVWQKIDNTDAVTSVNGYTGTVVLTAADVSAVPYTGATGAVDLNAKTLVNIANLGVNTTTVPTIKIRAVGDNSSTSRIAMRGYSSDANSSSIRVSKFRGSVAAPQAPLSGDSLGKFELAGYGTTSSDSYPQSSLEGVATENWGATARGAKAVVKVTPNTTTTQVTALTIDQDSKATFAGAVNVTGNTLLNQSYDQGTGVLQVTGQSTFNGVVTDKSLNLQGGNNLLLQSGFASGWNTQVSATLTPNNTTAPDGTNTASTAVLTSSNSSAIYQIVSSAGVGTYTMSTWIKVSSGTATFHMAAYNGIDGQVNSSQFTATTTWQLFTFTRAISSSSNWYPLITVPSDSGGTFQVWHPQLELGTVASAYTPTTTAAITTTNNISVPSGQVLGADGSVSLPSYSFGNKSNTGFWRPAGQAIAVTAGGTNYITFNYNAGGEIELPSTGRFAFSTNTDPAGTPDLTLYRDSANTLAQRNSTNAQTFRLYNTYTDASNYERLSIDWSTTANTATISTQNAGTGSARTLAIGQDLFVNSVRVGRGGGNVSTNTAVGNGAINATATGANNVACGYFSLNSLTSGGSNLGLGSSSLQSNTTGSSNSGIGTSTLVNNTTGNNNISIGYSSLNNNTTGSNNIGIGVFALQDNTIASTLTAIGGSALARSTTNVNTLGTVTGGTGYTNGTYTGVVMTYSSGSSAVTYPTATIVVAGGVVTTVTLTAKGVGFRDTTTVLTAPSASIGGTGSGFSVPVSSLQSSAENMAIGYNAGYTNTTGSNNVFAGTYAGLSATTGNNNVFIGNRCGFTGTATTTGSQLIYIGSDSKGSAATNTNEIAIGYNAVGLGSNTTVIGNSSTTLTKTFGVIVGTNYTVATLPSASTSGVGARAFVTDALAPVFGATVVTGGAVATPVYSDSVNWKVG